MDKFPWKLYRRASIMNDVQTSEVVNTHAGGFQFDDYSKSSPSSLCTNETKPFGYESCEEIGGYRSSNIARKRKSVEATVVSKRKRIDWEKSIIREDDTQRFDQDRVKQHAQEKEALAFTHVNACHLSEAAQVKMRYIIAEKELRRERAQHGKASDVTVAALFNAGECMRRLLDQRIEAVDKYWDQEINDLIATEKATFNAKQS